MIKFSMFKLDERGQGLVEYGLVLSLVSVVAIGSLTSVGGGVSDTFGGLFDGSGIVEEVASHTVKFVDHTGTIIDEVIGVQLLMR